MKFALKEESFRACDDCNDWQNLINQGKLDGLRYEKFDKNDSTYTLTFRKVAGTTPQSIAGEDFFK